MNGYRLGIVTAKPAAIWRAIETAPTRGDEDEVPVIVRGGNWPSVGSHGLLFLKGEGFRMRPRFRVLAAERDRELILALEDGLLEGWRFALALHRASPDETLVVRVLEGDTQDELSPWHLVPDGEPRARLVRALETSLDEALFTEAVAPKSVPSRGA